ITAEPKGLFIDGKWIAASSDELLDSVNPSTGKLLGRLALATERDVDMAVAAARRALEGPWSRFTPAERQNALLRLADLIEREFDDLCLMDSLDMGQPVAFSAFMRAMLPNTYRFAAAQAVSIH